MHVQILFGPHAMRLFSTTTLTFEEGKLTRHPPQP